MFTINEVNPINNYLQNNQDDNDENSLLNQKPYITVLNMEPKFSNVQRIIKCSIEFQQIGEVDTMNERYQAIVKTKAKWYENEVITEYDSKKHWNPKLYIENALHEKFQEEISYEVVNEEKRTLVIETRISKGSFWERMELNDFPLDIQELSICLTTKHKPEICTLEADPKKVIEFKDNRCWVLGSQVLNSFRDQQKFTLYRKVELTEKASYDEDSFSDKPCNKLAIITQKNQKSKFVAVCKCSRKPVYYLINAYSFNLLITVLSLTLFVIDTKLAQNRISGTFTLILTSFSFKVVTSKSLPTISYLTSLDKYQLINIVYLASCCVWHSVCASLKMEADQKFYLDKIILGCFGTFFLLIQIIFGVGIIKSQRNITKLEKEDKEFILELTSSVFEEDD